MVLTEADLRGAPTWAFPTVSFRDFLQIMISIINWRALHVIMCISICIWFRVTLCRSRFIYLFTLASLFYHVWMIVARNRYEEHPAATISPNRSFFYLTCEHCIVHWTRIGKFRNQISTFRHSESSLLKKKVENFSTRELYFPHKHLMLLCRIVIFLFFYQCNRCRTHVPNRVYVMLLHAFW